MEQLEQLLQALDGPDNNHAYRCLGLLVAESALSPAVYAHFDRLVPMLKSDSSYVRIRALVLIADNAKWDTQGKTATILEDYLAHIMDEKPTAARRCIQALPLLAAHQPALAPRIAAALREAEPWRYADSMRPLIERDIAVALKEIERR